MTNKRVKATEVAVKAAGSKTGNSKAAAPKAAASKAPASKAAASKAPASKAAAPKAPASKAAAPKAPASKAAAPKAPAPKAAASKAPAPKARGRKAAVLVPEVKVQAPPAEPVQASPTAFEAQTAPAGAEPVLDPSQVPIGRRLTERRRRLIANHVDTKPRRYWKLRFPMR